MKKVSLLSLLLLTLITGISCKKKEDDPAPATPVNQPSTTAPSLNSGTITSLNVQTGSSNSEVVNLSDVVTDPQGDAWTITSVSSSNTAVATIEAVSEGAAHGFEYSGLSAGTAVFTIIVTDVNGNSNTLSFTVTVSQSPEAPTLNSGVNTTFNIQEGSNTFWNLSDKVTDPQGDNWEVTDFVSSNTNIATVELDDSRYIEFTGVSPGTATMTITIADDDGHTSSFTATVNVSPKPAGPKDAEPK